MANFSLCGRSVDLQASPVPLATTRDASAWLHQKYISVRLTAPLEALRVHTDGKSFSGRKGSNEAGAWVLIGDVIHSSVDLANSRSLPTDNPRSMVAFTRTSEALIAPGTVLNVGIASAKFGGSGGGLQAEYVSGPTIIFRSLPRKYWHGSIARA